ncbi:unnamed protein product [Camellia sinensis]
MNNTAFFEEINKNKNRELDFDDVKTLASVFTLPVLAVESMFTNILISWTIMLCLNPSDTKDCLVEMLRRIR